MVLTAEVHNAGFEQGPVALVAVFEVAIGRGFTQRDEVGWVELEYGMEVEREDVMHF